MKSRFNALLFSGFVFGLLVARGIAATSTPAAPSPPQAECNFDEIDPAWQCEKDIVAIEDGVLAVHVPINQGRNLLYQAALFQDADVSVRVRRVAGNNLSSVAGLTFWADSSKEYYVLEIDGDGSFGVIRRTNGKVLWPVTFRHSDALKTGLNEWNELRVATKGNQATIWINGVQAISFKGQPPASGCQVGVDANSPADESIIYEFDDLCVR